MSFFLPADGSMSGLSCLLVCWGVLVDYGKHHDLTFGGWLYYSGFVVGNALFVALFVASLFWVSRAKARLWISFVALLQVLSWLVLNLVFTWRGDRFDLGVGYFVWLLAFIILSAAHLAGAGYVPGLDRPKGQACHVA